MRLYSGIKVVTIRLYSSTSLNIFFFLFSVALTLRHKKETQNTKLQLANAQRDKDPHFWRQKKPLSPILSKSKNFWIQRITRRLLIFKICKKKKGWDLIIKNRWVWLLTLIFYEHVQLKQGGSGFETFFCFCFVTFFSEYSIHRISYIWIKSMKHYI